MKHLVKSLDELHSIALSFIQSLQSHPTGATIVALKGNLGAGKTTFTQHVATILGVEDIVTSPTFVIEKIYKLSHKNFDHLIHIDAYRLDSGKELEVLGWKEISENPKNLIFIEWPERIAEILPSQVKTLSFIFVDETTREIEVE